MAFILLFGWPVFVFAGPGVEQNEPVIELARSYFDRGDIKHAAQILAELRRTDPENNEVLYWLAEAALAMEQYTTAITNYSEILARDPEHVGARHRRWLAYLAKEGPNAESRAKVRREIEQWLQDECLGAGCLYVAYRGYKYLWDRTRRASLMSRLVPLTAGEGVPKSIAARLPGELLEEILQARAPLRVELAGLFVKYFPRSRGIAVATRIFLNNKIAAGLTLDQFQLLLQDQPENRHLRLQGVPWLIHRRLLPNAEAVLAAYQRLYQSQSNVERVWYADVQGWRRINAWEQAQKDYLHGRLAMARQDWQAAERNLSSALVAHKEPREVWAALAEIYTQQHRTDNAINAWRRSTELGNTSRVARNMLRDLLHDAGISQIAPERHFAQHDNITVFEDVTAAAGLAQLKSHHVAWGDLDNDGDADLLLDGPLVLLNQQGRFHDRTVELGLDTELKSNGGLWVDVDNDGWLDLWLATERGNYIYKNLGGGGFIDVTGDVFARQKFTGRTEAAAWGDFNNDGWLDLYTANYEKRGLERGMCYRDQLFMNTRGTLQDVSTAMAVNTDAPLCGRGVIWTDLDDDGDQDILVANYRADRNLAWINSGNGFIDAARTLGLSGTLRKGAYGNSIGFAVADAVGDLNQELYLSNLAHPRYIDVTDASQFLVKTQDGFTDKDAGLGLRYEESNADPVFADFDNDGDADLYVSSIYPRALSHMYRNEGGKFADVTWMSGTRVDNAWGVAVADYDNDGDLDLFVARPGGVRLFRNDGPHGHWLQVVVRSPHCNFAGVGAQVRVRLDGREQRRELHVGRGSGSQDELIAHFGFGSAGSDAAQVTVRDLCGGGAEVQTPLDLRMIVETVPVSGDQATGGGPVQ